MKNNDTLQLLESLACNAQLQTPEAMLEEISQQDLTPELEQALINGDTDALTVLLEARSKVFCAILPAEDDDEDEGEKEGEGESEGQEQEQQNRIAV